MQVTPLRSEQLSRNRLDLHWEYFKQRFAKIFRVLQTFHLRRSQLTAIFSGRFKTTETRFPREGLSCCFDMDIGFAF